MKKRKGIEEIDFSKMGYGFYSLSDYSFIDDLIDLVDQKLKDERSKLKKTVKKTKHHDEDYLADLYEYFGDQKYGFDLIEQQMFFLGIISLYSFIERSRKRILVDLFKNQIKEKDMSYIKKLNQFLNKKNITHSNLYSYKYINELRALNNSIKHDGKVNEELNQINSYWQKGAALETSEVRKMYKNARNSAPIYLRDFYKKCYSKAVKENPKFLKSYDALDDLIAQRS